MFSSMFTSSSPFDTDVEKVTNEKNTTELWGPIMEICDRAGGSSTSAKDCIRSIIRRIHHINPHVALQACTLLDACVNNSGKYFHLEVASREFEQEYRKLITKSHTKVQEKLKELLRKWAEGDFKSDPQLNLIPSLYKSLRSEGVNFSLPVEPKAKQAPVNQDPNAVTSQEEEDDIVKAITLSLKELSPKGKTSGLYPSTSATASGTSTIHSTVSHTTEARKVRALYDFEAVEDNELTFKAGELIHVLDDSDPNWWKGYNKMGEGLFPSNFVTTDLSAESEIKLDQPKKSVQFNESVTVKVMKKETAEINEEKIDRLLHFLHEANPEEDNSDSTEMLDLEEQVNSMGPLIDNELERVDRKHAHLTQLSADLVEAFNLYHTLMREPGPQAAPAPYQSVPKGPPFAYQHVQNPPPHPMFNGGPSGSTPYAVPPDQYTMQGPPGPPPGTANISQMPSHFIGRGGPGPENVSGAPVQFPPNAMYPLNSMMNYPPFGQQGSHIQGQQGGPPQSQAAPPGTFSSPRQQLL